MGSSDDGAAREAQAAERERQSAIQNSVNRINQVFDNPNREAQYADVLNAARAFYQRDLDEKNTENNRQLKFSLARSGNTGGSLARDQGTNAGKAYSRGLLEADRLAQSQQANLRSDDQSARLNLIAMAQSGLDATTGAQQAASAMRNNLQAGKATSAVDGVGDIFGSFANIYRTSREDYQRRRGEKDIYNSLYGTPKI